MKFKYIYIYTLLLGISVSSCKKYLGVAPDNRTEINTSSKIRDLLGTAYPQANWIPVAESMSDNVTDKGEGRATVDFDLELAYYYQDSKETNQDSPTYYWNLSFEAIAAANQALKSISESPKPETLASEKAEALICRAYSHFMLVNLFAKPYNESTSATDLGIPYVTEVENVVFKKYKRETVAKVYESIEKDLLEALPNVDDSRYKVPKYHFTKVAANAFASRFFLFKKDYAKSAQYANEVLGPNFDANNLRPWLTLFRGTSNDIRVNFTKATLPSNLLLVEASSWWSRTYDRTRYGLTSALQDGGEGLKAISPALNVTGNRNWAYRTYIRGQENPFYPKWNEFFYAPNDPRFGVGYVMIPLFTLEETLFNRAEANIYLGNYDAAMSDLNKFVSQRFDGYTINDNITTEKVTTFYNTTIDKALIQNILDFKRVEFLYEGIRWLDILRYDIPVTHRIKNENGVIIQRMEFKADDLRRQWQLPESVTSAGVELNPR